MDADDRLKALFAEDEPPARDARFSAEVLAELARRRFVADLWLLAGLAGVGGLVLWALWPLIGPALAAVGPSMGPVAACLTVAAVAVALLNRPFGARGAES